MKLFDKFYCICPRISKSGEIKSHYRHLPTLTFFIFHLLVSISSAQFQKPVFEHITTREGLSQSTVNHILQDRNGFLWFATNDGLNKYDAYSFKVYRNNTKERTSLSSNDITFLMEDNKGYIWIVNGSRTGLDRFDPESETFENFKHDPSNPESLSSNRIYQISQDSKGNIWICTENALNLFIPPEEITNEKARFEHYRYTGSSAPITWVFENSNGQLLLFSAYLYLFDPLKKEIVNTGIWIGNFVRSVIEDDNADILIGTTYDGIIKLEYDERTKTFRKGDPGKLNVTPGNRNYLLRDHNNHIWIGTELKGLYQYIPETDMLLHYEPDELDYSTINDNTVFSLYEDNTGVLWIGTFSYGLNKIDFYRNQFIHYRKIPYKKNSLGGNVISSIHGLNPNELWVGLDVGGGVNRILFSGDQEPKFIHYLHDPKDPNTIGGNSTLCLVHRKNGEVWVGSGNGMISRIRPEQAFSGQKPVIINYQFDRWTFAIFEDSEGILWGGTWEAGLWRYNDKMDKFDFFIPDPSNKYSIGDDIIWSIGEDQHKNIWIGGHGNGISVLTADEKRKPSPKFKHLSNEKNNPESISNNTINAFCKAHDGTLWICTAGGLNKVVNHGKITGTFKNFPEIAFKSYHASDGLPAEGVVGIVEDNKGFIWLSSANGISKMNPQSEEFINFNENHGLQSNEFWHNAYFKNADGRIFFGGQNGFNAFYPDKIVPNPFSPKVVITELLLFNKMVKVGDTINNQVVLKEPIHRTREIILSYKNNIITFQFAALHFAQPSLNRYAYYLEGFEDDWNSVGNKREASYTNLNPGIYTFMVKASNNDGIWNEIGITLRITIRPPWWNTSLFKISIIIFILGIALGFYFYRINLLEKQKKILEDLVKQRTKEIEEKNTVLTNQAEELNKSNTVLEERQLFIEEQTEELLAQNEYLQIANDQSLKEQAMIKQQAQDLEETNQKLTVLNATKDKLFSIIAHDLKNPFNSILSFSEILMNKFKDLAEDKKLKFIHAIFDSSHRVYDLLENLLQWARSQTGNIQYMPEAFNLDEVIDANYDLVKNMLDEKEITITKGSTDNIIVFADRNMINTVIRNLLSNAIKYTEKGTISVDIVLNGDYAEVNVTDSGTGISEAKMATLFEIEQNKSSAGTRNEKGSGLGLLICRDFVQINKGEITVKSTQGMGTTFTFTVPQSV
jgi:signal transduction histidine kinase/ligand-binding sensor domain-containing protein